MYRIFSVGLLVVVFVVFTSLPALSADDKDTGTSFMGKVSKIDATKRQLTLTDVRPGTTDKPAAPEKDKAATAAAGTYMFDVSADAKVTLDGSKADLKDLKEGYFAHVWLTKGEKITTSDKDKNIMTGKVDHVEAFTKAPPAPKDK